MTPLTFLSKLHLYDLAAVFFMAAKSFEELILPSSVATTS